MGDLTAHGDIVSLVFEVRGKTRWLGEWRRRARAHVHVDARRFWVETTDKTIPRGQALRRIAMRICEQHALLGDAIEIWR